MGLWLRAEALFRSCGTHRDRPFAFLELPQRQPFSQYARLAAVIRLYRESPSGDSTRGSSDLTSEQFPLSLRVVGRLYTRSIRVSSLESFLFQNLHFSLDGPNSVKFVGMKCSATSRRGQLSLIGQHHSSSTEAQLTIVPFPTHSRPLWLLDSMQIRFIYAISQG
ncbi:unnamed protein product [Sphagnum balticum]